MLPHAIRADQRSGDMIINRLQDGASKAPPPTGFVAAGRMTQRGALLRMTRKGIL